MRLKVLSFALAALFVMADTAKAQFAQYTPPGGPEDRPQDRKQRLEDEIRRTRHHLGRMRIAPLYGVRDVAYVRNLLSSQSPEGSDFTATAAAGLRGYLRTGSKITWIATVLPEYVWWQEREDARRLNLNYGLTGLGFFNHLTVELGGRREEQQQIVTPELLELANTRSDSGRLNAELKLTGKLYAFGSFSVLRQDHLVDEREDPVTRGLALLDRDEKLARAGLRWRPRTGWTVGLGIEHSETEFNRSLVDSSNSGDAPVLELLIERRRFYAQADVAARSLDASEGSQFVEFDGITGRASVFVQTGRRLELGSYTSRNLVYSLSPSSPYLIDERVGIAAQIGFLEQLNLRLYAETGNNEYVYFLPTDPEQVDDLTAIGGRLRVTLPGPLDVVFEAARTRYDSNRPGADRSFTSAGVSVTLGGNFGSF